MSQNGGGIKSKIGIFGLLEEPFIVTEWYFSVNIVLIIVYCNKKRDYFSNDGTFKTKSAGGSSPFNCI